MKCENCGKHEGTQKWVGDGGFLAVTHDIYTMWCAHCCLKAQIEYAKKLAADIPKLEKELEKVECK